MRARRDRKSGALHVQGIPDVTFACLLHLPQLLDDDEPGVAALLGRNAHGEEDAAARAEWERLAAPEVRRLFLSARAIVTADLAGTALLDPTPRRGATLVIPAGHESAWLSALSAARVALHEAHDVNPATLARPEDVASLPRERVRAFLLADHLGWLQEILLRAVSG